MAKHRAGSVDRAAPSGSAGGETTHRHTRKIASIAAATALIVASLGGLTIALAADAGSPGVDLESAEPSWTSTAAVMASRQNLATSRSGGQRVLLGSERLESIERQARETVREDRLAEARRVARTEARKAARQHARQAARKEARREAREHAAEHRRQEQLQTQWGVPIEGYGITAGYGQSSSLWSGGTHTGVDLDAVTGTPVTSVGPGIVVTAGYGGSYGNKIVIRHEDGSETWYAHLSAINVSVGAPVTNETVIGLVGATGNVTGDHLHLEFRPGGGNPVDPVAALTAYGVNL